MSSVCLVPIKIRSPSAIDINALVIPCSGNIALDIMSYSCQSPRQYNMMAAEITSKYSSLLLRLNALNSKKTGWRSTLFLKCFSARGKCLKKTEWTLSMCESSALRMLALKPLLSVES